MNGRWKHLGVIHCPEIYLALVHVEEHQIAHLLAVVVGVLHHLCKSFLDAVFTIAFLAVDYLDF